VERVVADRQPGGLAEDSADRDWNPSSHPFHKPTVKEIVTGRGHTPLAEHLPIGYVTLTDDPGREVSFVKEADPIADSATPISMAVAGATSEAAIDMIELSSETNDDSPPTMADLTAASLAALRIDPVNGNVVDPDDSQWESASSEASEVATSQSSGRLSVKQRLGVKAVAGVTTRQLRDAEHRRSDNPRMTLIRRIWKDQVAGLIVRSSPALSPDRSLMCLVTMSTS